jgi:hypothetical protein
MSVLRYLLARMREPSTMAAVSVLAALIGVPPGTVDAAAQIVAGVAAVAAAVMPDRGQ